MILNTNYENNNYGHRKIVISSKTISADTLIYNALQHIADTSFSGAGWTGYTTTTSLTNSTITLKFIDNPAYFLNTGFNKGLSLCPPTVTWQYFCVFPFGNPPPKIIAYDTNTVFNTPIISYPYQPTDYIVSSDSLYLTGAGYGPCYDAKTFGNQFGVISYSWNQNQYPQNYSYDSTLVGCIKGGVQIGTITPIRVILCRH